MPFARPSLGELIHRAASDIEVGLPGSDARLRRSNLAVLARVHAGAVHGLYGHLAWLADQLMIDTAEAAYLERYAAIWGVLRLPAAFAEGAVTLRGTSGVVVPAGAPLQRSDGQAYRTSADVTLVGGAATAPVVASEAGALGNADAGTAVTMSQPVAGVKSAALVASVGLTQGADAETDVSLRARVLARVRQAPQGGSKADYVSWALEVPGVTRAWCYPLEGGPGTVTVRFVRDGDASFIPELAEVAAVQAHVDVLRPVCAAVTVLAPVARPLNLSITLTPNTAATRAAVQAELADLLHREAEPGGTILLSHLREAVSISAGERNHTMTAPSADVAHATGTMATLGTITWS